MRFAPFFSGVVLTLTDQLTTWWGILIMLFALSIASAVTAEANPDRRIDTAEFFTVCIPMVAAFYIGNAAWHPWGAFIGVAVLHPVGVVVADAYGSRYFPFVTDAGMYEHGAGNRGGRSAKRHAKHARRQGLVADYSLASDGWIVAID